MRAVVTGSAGNIGAPLTRYLRGVLNWTVLEIDAKPGWRDEYIPADITNAADLFRVVDFKPDVIFHLAAMVSRVTCEDAPASAIATNITGTQNIIQLAHQTSARLVYFSTSEVYGNTTGQMSETITPEPNNRYGLSKLLAERLVEYEIEKHDLDAIILRPFMIYDEFEDMGSHRSAMIRFAEDLYRGFPVVVHSGSARGWLHVSDALRAITSAAVVQDRTIVNIGHPEIRPIGELARMIADEYGVPHSLIVDDDLPDRMTLVKVPLLKRQEGILGVVPSVGLREGVRRVCEVMRERVR